MASRCDRLLDGRIAFLCAGNLNEEIGTICFLVQDLAAAETDSLVSYARSGDNSSETKPSLPAVRS